MNFKFPTLVPTSLRTLIPSAGEEGCRLMTELLLWDPYRRPSAAQVSLEAAEYRSLPSGRYLSCFRD